MSGGSGYVLSRAALDKFIEFIPNATEQQCPAANSTVIEDLEMGRCLLNAGAYAGDSRDDELKMRYYPLNPYGVLKSNHLSSDFWIYTRSYYHINSVKADSIF